MSMARQGNMLEPLSKRPWQVSGAVQTDRKQLVELVSHDRVLPEMLQTDVIVREATFIGPECEEEHARESLLAVGELVVVRRISRHKQGIGPGAFWVVHMGEC